MKITVDLASPAAEQVERAARVRKQSPADFLAQAAEDASRRALLDEAIARWERDPDNESFSELAAEYGLWVEELMREIWRRNRLAAAESGRAPEDEARATYHGDPEAAEAMFLAGCRTLAELRDDPDLLRRAEDVVASRRRERPGAASS